MLSDEVLAGRSAAAQRAHLPCCDRQHSNSHVWLRSNTRSPVTHSDSSIFSKIARRDIGTYHAVHEGMTSTRVDLTPTHNDLEIADLLHRAIAAAQDGRLGDRKVFISAAWTQMVAIEAQTGGVLTEGVTIEHLKTWSWRATSHPRRNPRRYTAGRAGPRRSRGRDGPYSRRGERDRHRWSHVPFRPRPGRGAAGVCSADQTRD
jgi:hypothetical protein